MKSLSFLWFMCSKPIYCALKIVQKSKRFLEVGSTPKVAQKLPSTIGAGLAGAVYYFSSASGDQAHYRDFFLRPPKNCRLLRRLMIW